MKIIIQCAASKDSGAGWMLTDDGRQVMFVADPTIAPAREGYVYARPDDLSDDGTSWRERLVVYNKNSQGNPLGLYPAYRLYENEAYGVLVQKYGIDNVYILSAGWGLIRAGFLAPQYDITYSQSAEAYKRRRKTHRYADLCQLPDESRDDLVLFSGKDYLPLFQTLTRSYAGVRHVFYNSTSLPPLEGCQLIRYHTTTRTNWHYECIRAFVNGTVKF